MNNYSVFTKLWHAFVRGIAFVAPVAITLAFLVWLAGVMEDFVGGIIRWILPQDWYIPGMGLLAGIGFTIALGLIGNVFLVQWIVKALESFVNKIPLIKYLFQAVKDVARFISTDTEDELGEVVVVEFDHISMVGFIVQKENKTLQKVMDGNKQSLSAVFIPMSYQMGGYTLYVADDQIKRLSLDPGSAFRAILTGGSFDRINTAEDQSD